MSSTAGWQVLGKDRLSNETYPLQTAGTEIDARVGVQMALEASRQWDTNFADGEDDESNRLPDSIVLVHPDGHEEVFSAN
jgi:hypothetical protein